MAAWVSSREGQSIAGFVTQIEKKRETLVLYKYFNLPIKGRRATSFSCRDRRTDSGSDIHVPVWRTKSSDAEYHGDDEQYSGRYHDDGKQYYGT